MKATALMLNGQKHTIDFTECKDLIQIRNWLNRSAPFISIGCKLLINQKNIQEITEYKKEEDNYNEQQENTQNDDTTQLDTSRL